VKVDIFNKINNSIFLQRFITNDINHSGMANIYEKKEGPIDSMKGLKCFELEKIRQLLINVKNFISISLAYKAGVIYTFLLQELQQYSQYKIPCLDYTI
jgi:hypothetical protein